MSRLLSFSHWAQHFLVIFDKVPQFVQNSILAQDQHVLTFLHCADHFLAIFSKGHHFVQNSVISPRSARFLTFALGEPLLSEYMSLFKTAFSARDQHVQSYLHCLHHFFYSFQQIPRVCPKSKKALLAGDQHVLSFSHCAQHLLAIFSKMHEFVNNSVSWPRLAVL